MAHKETWVLSLLGPIVRIVMLDTHLVWVALVLFLFLLLYK